MQPFWRPLDPRFFSKHNRTARFARPLFVDPPAGGGEGEGGGGGGAPKVDPPAGGGGEIKDAAAKEKADREAGERLGTKLKAAETERDALKKELETLKAKPTPKGDDKSKDLLDRIDKLEKALEGANESVKNERKVREDAVLDGAIGAIAAKLNDGTAAARLLRLDAAIGKDGKSAVFKVTDDKGVESEVAATYDNAIKHKLIPDSFIPAPGRRGTGSQPPKAGTDGAPDFQRASRDRVYFKTNRDALRDRLVASGKKK